MSPPVQGLPRWWRKRWRKEPPRLGKDWREGRQTAGDTAGGGLVVNRAGVGGGTALREGLEPEGEGDGDILRAPFTIAHDQ